MSSPVLYPDRRGRACVGRLPACRAVAAAPARYRALHRRLGTQIDPRNLAFSPQYPLWSDGAHKRRWISSAAGTAIDASRPDAWEFPRRHAPVEGVLARSSGRDALHRAPPGRQLAFRGLCLERGGHGRDACARRWHRTPRRRTAAIPFRPSPTVAPVTRAPPFRCWDSARCNCHPIAIRSHRTRTHRTDIDLDGLVARGLIRNLPAARARGRASKRARPSSAQHSVICTATAAIVTTTMARPCLSI